MQRCKRNAVWIAKRHLIDLAVHRQTQAAHPGGNHPFSSRGQNCHDNEESVLENERPTTIILFHCWSADEYEQTQQQSALVHCRQGPTNNCSGNLPGIGKVERSQNSKRTWS